MKNTKKLLVCLTVLSVVFAGAWLALMDLLSRPATFTFLQRTEAALPPRLAAFHEREQESADKMRQTAERDKAEAAKQLGPPPAPRLAQTPMAIPEGSRRRVPRQDAFEPEQPFGGPLGYAPERGGKRGPRSYPMFGPSQGFNDRHGN